MIQPGRPLLIQEPPKKEETMTEKRFKKNCLSRLLPILILLLGACLRLFRLGSVPGGMHQDESFVTWNAFGILHEGMDSAGHRFPVYMADWGDGHSALYVWLLMPLLALNGGHFSPFLSRLPQAVVSVCTLWSVYCLIKCLFHRKLALWSLFLLAICPWHIMMSRWGLDANLAPGFLIFGLTFFVKGLEQKKYLLLSGLFYGASLYCYAVIWPAVPFMLLLQIVYCLAHKKLRIDRWSLGASLILFIMAVPLLLFLLVNSEVIPQITLPFMTIPRMGSYRGSEIALTPSGMWSNLRTALSLLWHQSNGSAFDILLPWGLFYDIGRVFIVIGTIALLLRLLRSFRERKFCPEYFLFVPLLGGALTCLLVTAILHQINALYIPLVLSEAYGVWTVTEWIMRKRDRLAEWICRGIVVIYLLCLVLFQRDYYGDYRTLVSAWFGEGVEDCVGYAMDQCSAEHIDTIVAEKGTQWPRLLLYTETLPSQYLSTVIHDTPPTPACFTTDSGICIHVGIDYDNIDRESIYIIYFIDVSAFENDFTLTQFHDWYVAVPKRD
ncbi:MAG: glycosyltransferase family 39 protein [Lachnospiraceae bacterium]|nr:glycosyltransferase family 39 protein [Lachnospiraceae bacterium]